MDSLIEQQGISSHRPEYRSQVVNSFRDDRFRDGIRIEKGAQTQQLGCGRVGLLDLLKRKRPGASHRMRVVGGDKATLPLEEIQAALLIEGQVLREAASDFLNICTSLIQRQRKAIQSLHDLLSLGTHYLRDVVEGLIYTKQFSPVQQELHTFCNFHLLNRET